MSLTLRHTGENLALQIIVYAEFLIFIVIITGSFRPKPANRSFLGMTADY
jgi:hypothetical protein